MNDKSVLEKFLNFSSHEKIFHEFSKLNNSSVSIISDNAKNFIYIPGKRKDRILLVSSLVSEFDYEVSENSIFENGVYKSRDIKARLDVERAGSAILYLLRDTGHSLLIIVDKDTWDVFSPNVLQNIKKCNKDLYCEFNQTHQYILEFNYKNSNNLNFCSLPVTQDFKDFLKSRTGFNEAESKKFTYSNIKELCEDICGVSVSAGYYKPQKRTSFLKLDAWEKILDIFRIFLKEPQPLFRISK